MVQARNDGDDDDDEQSWLDALRDVIAASNLYIFQQKANAKAGPVAGVSPSH